MADTKKRDFGGLMAHRMNSCVGAPQEEILHAFKSGNLHLFCDLLQNDDLDINFEYAEEEHSTILFLCTKAGLVDFVSEIIRRPDVNCLKPHKMLQKTPLHVAVEAGSVALVNRLIRLSDINAKMGNGNTALHLAALRSKANWIEDAYEKQRVQHDFVIITKMIMMIPGINLDYRNKIGATPLFYAVDKGTEEVAKLLISRGACVTIEVDEETIEEKIEEKMPHVVNGLSLNRQDNDSVENKLFHLLYNEAFDPGKFKEAWIDAERNNNTVKVDSDNGTYTYLQYCADQVRKSKSDALIFKWRLFGH